jgi:hypothetical protein
MPVNYLLPCQCGKKTEIDSSQAGLSVRCACGAELVVPTMRGLAALERVEAAPRDLPLQSEAAWGARQGLRFLGSTIVVVAALAALGIWWARMPQAPTLLEGYQEQNRGFVDQQDLEALMLIWRDLRGGIEHPGAEAYLDKYDSAVAEVLGWEMVIAAFGAVGLVLLVTGLLLRPGTPARPPAAARAMQ